MLTFILFDFFPFDCEVIEKYEIHLSARNYECNHV